MPSCQRILHSGDRGGSYIRPGQSGDRGARFRPTGNDLGAQIEELAEGRAGEADQAEEEEQEEG